MATPTADRLRLSHILADDLQPRIDWAYQLEQALSLLGGSSISSGNGDPNGLVTADEGDLFLDRTTPALWQNQDGATTWAQLGSAAGTVASVNGDAGPNVVLDAADIGSTATGDVAATDVQGAIAELASEKATVTALAAEATLARNADNLTSGTVADARIAATLARDSEVTTAVAAEATLARNADNLSSGTVADARIASTIARDSEVTSAVAAEAALARDADNLTGGTVADARIASTIARDSEVTSAVAAEAALARNADNLTSGTVLDARIDAAIARDSEVTAAVAAEATARDAAIAAALAGLDVKPDVAYASTSALPANTYANGSSGVGATLTGNANGPLIIDGVTILVAQAGERVLVTAEAASANNGWYTITQVGVVAVSPYILTRATESDQAAEIGAGYLTGVVAPNGVTAGTNNGKLYISVAADPFVVGTTALTFSQVGSTYSAGTGLGLSGNVFSIDTAITVDKTTAQTLTNKTLTSPVLNTGVSGTAIDTDATMAANSDTLLASQKAIKTALATFQPLDSDLTTIAGLTATTDNMIQSVAGAWASRTPAQVRTALSLVVGTNVQAWDADLDTIAGLTPTTDNFIVSVASAWASRTPAQVRTTLGLVIGTNVQAYDADLTTYAGITPGALGQAILPMTTLTDKGLVLGRGAAAPAALAPDSGTTKFLKNSVASGDPTWQTIAESDVASLTTDLTAVQTQTATQAVQIEARRLADLGYFVCSGLALSQSTTGVTGITRTSGNNTFDKTAHGLVAGDTVIITGVVNTTGVTNGVTYYVVSTGLTANAFRVATTLGGTALTLGGTTDTATILATRVGQLAMAAGVDYAATTELVCAAVDPIPSGGATANVANLGSALTAGQSVWVFVELDVSGVVNFNAGVAGTNPVFPTLTTTRTPLGVMWIPFGATAIDTLLTTNNGNAKLIDLRNVRAVHQARLVAQDHSATVTTPGSSTTLATILGAAISLPANSWQAGDAIVIDGQVTTINNIGASAVQLQIAFAGASAYVVTSASLAQSALARRHNFRAVIVIGSVGASGTFLSKGEGDFGAVVTSFAVSESDNSGQTAAAIDTTAACAIDVKARFVTASNGATFTLGPVTVTKYPIQ